MADKTHKKDSITRFRPCFGKKKVYMSSILTGKSGFMKFILFAKIFMKCMIFCALLAWCFPCLCIFIFPFDKFHDWFLLTWIHEGFSRWQITCLFPCTDCMNVYYWLTSTVDRVGNLLIGFSCKLLVFWAIRSGA